MAFEKSQTELDPEAAAASVSSQFGLSPTEHLETFPLAIEPDDFIGSVLVGRYFIEKKLGQGGMGAVYLGRDRRLMDKPVVVKILRAEFAADDWVVTKFLQEKEALTRAHHPGIVGILDAGELSSGKPFIVMEYIDGITLDEAMDPAGMELKRVAHLIKQIGSALAAAHEKGILHRDLKPANIMLQPLAKASEQVRIIDFGIARVHDSLVSNHTMAGRFGTYVYMSPEQFRVEELTAASDIYSMGAIAYEMITGRPPLEPSDFANLGEMYNAGLKILPRTLRPDLPEQSQKLIRKALALRPEHRFQSASEFGDALAESLAASDSRQLFWQNRPRFSQLSVPVVVITGVILAVVIAAGLAARSLWPSPFGRVNKPAAEPPNQAPANHTVPVTATVATPAATPNVSLTYWLTIEKAKDKSNKFESSGDQPFENGDAFRFNVTASKSGYLYVLNEGVSAAGQMNFTLIYPTPKAGNGSTRLESGRTIQTGTNRFGGQPGREQFWIVWSDVPIQQLEDARNEAFKKVGRLIDQDLANNVREFFANNYDSLKPLPEETNNHRTSVQSMTNKLVKLLELEHR